VAVHEVSPGVTIEYSDATPNAVAVRGFRSQHTGVQMDGARSPTLRQRRQPRVSLHAGLVNNMSPSSHQGADAGESATHLGS